MQRKTRFLGTGLAAALAMAVAACASFPVPVVPTAGSSEQRAADLARQGNHAQAAAAYEGLAASQAPGEQFDLLLMAAREWLAANRPVDAARVLASVTAPLSSPQGYQRALLLAQVSLASARIQLAWQQISALAASTVPSMARDYYLLRMTIALADARPIDGILAEIAAEQTSNDAAVRIQLRTQLLAALLAARARGVQLLATSSEDPTVRGWLELGATAVQPRSVSLNAAALAQRWRAQYPNHPAVAILNQAFPVPLGGTAPGSRIALLLPLTGPYAADGLTVRDGFLSALYQLAAPSRPQLSLYDTAAMPAAQLIEQARSAGSTSIVGPLLPNDVSAAAALGAEPIPMLALNFLPDDQAAPSGLYQYAISPEEEAQLAARRILADGHHRGIVLAPRDAWGTRVANAFERELTLGGGSTLALATYDPQGHDYGDELRNVLRIDDSQARYESLQRALGTKLNFEPRHRGDVEFVFIVAETAINARLIEPQLKFAYASDIPTYSISNAYEPDSLDANRDIDGLMYPDMPWMIDGDSSVAELRNTLGQAWGNRAAWHSRLFAFGYDACQLVLAMSAPYGNVTPLQIDGLTGQLHFDADHRVQRDLIWVRMSEGAPKPVLAAAASGDAGGATDAGGDANAPPAAGAASGAGAAGAAGAGATPR